MKNIKFKVLIMFMLLVLVGLGSSSVFAEEIPVLKVNNLYRLEKKEDYTIYYLYGVNGAEHDYGSIEGHFKSMVIDKTFKVAGIEYIKYSDWMNYINTYGDEEIFNASEKNIRREFGKDLVNWYSKQNFIKYSDPTKTYAFKDAMKENLKEYANSGADLLEVHYNKTGRKMIDAVGSGAIAEKWNELYLFIINSNEYVISGAITADSIISKWSKPEYKKIRVELKKDMLELWESNILYIDSDYNSKDFWKQAFYWFKGAQNSGGMGSVTEEFMEGAKNIIKMIGNMIFIIVTSILGVKYIWGSADAKYSVKNSLFSLVIAAVVFYGWDSISNIMQAVTNSAVGNNVESTAKTIYTYILYFVNIAAIGGIIFLGAKYLLASAEGKSQLKMNMGPAFLGIIMVYATISFLNTILSIFLG